MSHRLTVMQLLPALAGGGAEQGTLEIAQALIEGGARSIVVSAGGALLPSLQATGSHHIQLPIGAKRLRTLALVWRLRQAMVEHQVDLVHARSRLPAWLGWLALRRLKPRPAFVTTLHGLNSANRYSAIMTRGDRVIAVSRVCRDYWLEHFPQLDPQRVVVIHRGIDPQLFDYGYRPRAATLDRLRYQYGIDPNDALLTLPGRISRYKGHGVFIRLIARLRQQGFNCHGLVPGAFKQNSRYLGKVHAQIKQYGLEQHISLLGPRSDIKDIMAASAVVYSLSGKPESFGRIAAEALALGRPVIAYAHGGIGEVLEAIFPYGGIAPGDEDALLERSAQVLTQQVIVPDYQPFLKSEMVDRTLAVYRTLTSGR